MKPYILIACTAVLLLSNACTESNAGSMNIAEQPLSETAWVARGAYLVGIMGCNDCHSPKVMGPQGPMPDPSRLLSGHPSDQPLRSYDPEVLKSWVLFDMGSTAAVGPWGVSFAANLTPDPSGIGYWTEAQFAKALREGKYKGLDQGRALLPPMPWQAYSQLRDEDLKAIFHYLKSLPQVKNIVPQPIPPAG